ncbi:MAG: lysophospholipid acyltransferase family protein [Myxococcaceae bacterium]
MSALQPIEVAPATDVPPLRKRVKRYVRFLLVRSALAIVSSLPLRFAAWLGRGFGLIAFRVARGERRKALESLTRAFPEWTPEQREATARAMFRHLGQAAFEVGCIRQIDPRMDELVEWSAEDRAVLDRALARNKGVVFVTGHVGNWELLARRVALAGYPAQSIAKETTDPRTTALIEKFRREGKVGSIWRGQGGAAKHMLRALKAGEILGLLIDQDTKVQSVFVPFFGHRASTPRAAADLALRTDAAVIMGFCHRIAEGTKYRLSLKRLEPLPSSGDRERDAIELTARMTAEIERAIRERPEQWVWMHRRWKTQSP